MNDLTHHPQSESSPENRSDKYVTPLRKILRENLVGCGTLAHLRKDWELGRWESLASVDIDACQDKQTFWAAALLVAVANQQLGNDDRVRECVGYALSAGASRALAIAVLASGVHNQLGRARAIAGDHEAATSQYRRAVEVGTDAGRCELAAAARFGEQADQLGLHCGRHHSLGFTANAAPHSVGQETDTDPVGVYAHAPQFLVEREAPPFVLLDSKSLPRSGLHYVRSILQERLGDRFSFCEWYQEPGCCRSQPCRLTGFLDRRSNASGPSVRLVKSHDFDLDDRIFPPSFSLRRLVLKRDPLYILTSWFALDQLSAHRTYLDRAGIRMEKIWLQHESAVLSMAYAIVDQNFRPPSTDELDAWLSVKAEYIRAFQRKWVENRDVVNSPYSYVVDYIDLFQFVHRFLDELDSCDDSREENPASAPPGNNQRNRFQTRSDPFTTRSQAITDYIRSEADRFERYAATVVLRE